MFQMSFPKPSFDMMNSKMPIGRADLRHCQLALCTPLDDEETDTNAVTAKKSSRANILPVTATRMITARTAAPPETPVTIGVM